MLNSEKASFYFLIFVKCITYSDGVNITIMETQKLNLLQLELLKVYSFEPSEEDLLAIRKMLAQYFSDKLIIKVQQSVEQQNLTEKDLESWLNE